ncbi:hypothetical protein SISSUDRAFT_128442 [Sistotremastrum suecicum HHB10207 ss-3]|uniref:Uncharacterized protein n=1 Tax=Sistotremastrum suecicum HHB10207 ss-3 TaxID=1314776 RepID=A0A166AYP4_9AGAM|nr:hypothetical protein SISSUDRAFT_128442 [Sistotremastrum suecicum HHB10207 ss-3]
MAASYGSSAPREPSAHNPVDDLTSTTLRGEEEALNAANIPLQETPSTESPTDDDTSLQQPHPAVPSQIIPSPLPLPSISAPDQLNGYISTLPDADHTVPDSVHDLISPPNRLDENKRCQQHPRSTLDRECYPCRATYRPI